MQSGQELLQKVAAMNFNSCSCFAAVIVRGVNVQMLDEMLHAMLRWQSSRWYGERESDFEYQTGHRRRQAFKKKAEGNDQLNLQSFD
jgi:hypothetical protein